MTRNPLIDVLQQNKHLRSKAEVLAFDNALQALAQSQQDEDLSDLLAVFTDECQHHEVMYGLVHCVESFDMKKYLAALVEAVPSMRIHAPEWTKSLHCHILNDAASRECFKKLYQSASPAAKEAVKAVLLKIQADDTEFSSRVRQLVA
jgi:Immunity protein 30